MQDRNFNAVLRKFKGDVLRDGIKKALERAGDKVSDVASKIHDMSETLEEFFRDENYHDISCKEEKIAKLILTFSRCFEVYCISDLHAFFQYGYMQDEHTEQFFTSLMCDGFKMIVSMIDLILEKTPSYVTKGKVLAAK